MPSVYVVRAGRFSTPTGSIPVEKSCAPAEEQRVARLDGSRRRGRGQRGHGELLLLATKERPGHPPLGHPPRPPAGDRVLDRNQIQPPTPPTDPRPAHPRRV